MPVVCVCVCVCVILKMSVRKVWRRRRYLFLVNVVNRTNVPLTFWPQIISQMKSFDVNELYNLRYAPTILHS
jgi:hypothetical protein